GPGHFLRRFRLVQGDGEQFLYFPGTGVHALHLEGRDVFLAVPGTLADPFENPLFGIGGVRPGCRLAGGIPPVAVNVSAFLFPKAGSRPVVLPQVIQRLNVRQRVPVPRLDGVDFRARRLVSARRFQSAGIVREQVIGGQHDHQTEHGHQPNGLPFRIHHALPPASTSFFHGLPGMTEIRCAGTPRPRSTAAAIIVLTVRFSAPTATTTTPRICGLIFLMTTGDWSPFACTSTTCPLRLASLIVRVPPCPSFSFVFCWRCSTWRSTTSSSVESIVTMTSTSPTPAIFCKMSRMAAS